MQAVRYARASSVDEAITLLRDGGEGARVLAGGTDVIVQARERRRRVELFVDIKHIPELMGITHDAGGGLTVGAATPLYRIYGDTGVQQRFPALAEATHVIGGKAIQGRATLGGNLANASPAADSIPAMMVLGGVARVAGPRGPREVAVTEFCSGPGRNVLQPGEFITSIHFPAPAAGSGQAWERFIPRNEMDIAVVNAATYIAFEGDVVADARFALGAVAATPLSVPAAAEAIRGRRLTDDVIAAAAAAARETATPITDMRGTIRQRKHLAGVLTEHVIRRAIERARG